MAESEKFIGITNSYKVGRDPDSQVLVILKKARELLGIEGKIYFYLKVDSRGRLIYEPLDPQPGLPPPKIEAGDVS